MRARTLLLPWALMLLVFSGCVPTYTLVKPTAVRVAGGGLTVRPSVAWNRMPQGSYDSSYAEGWTLNGPALDAIGFVAGLPEGKTVISQSKKADQKVPAFRASMTPNDLVSMIESFYRIRVGATVFETQSVKPASFLGSTAIEFNYRYVGSDEVKRMGRTVMTVSGGKLYLMTLDGAALHYFAAALPEFERLIASASIS